MSLHAEDQVCQMEALEPRLLLSHAPVALHHPMSLWQESAQEAGVSPSTGAVATPDFMLYQANGSAHPATVSSPVGLTPSIVRHAYGIDSSYFGSVVGNGAGQTIAIVDAYNDPNIAADLRTFDQQLGLPDPPSLTVIGQDGTSNLPGTDPSGKGNSWAIEIALDVEWAHAVAPGANIVLVEARSAGMSDLFTAVDTARQYANVSVVSMSWGGGEFNGETSYDPYFTTPAGHGGVTFVASSGDSGAYDPNTRTRDVGYPAASPNVLSVGGTLLTVDANGNYIAESGWGNGTSSGYYGGSGGGLSQVEMQPAYQGGVVTSSSRAVPDVSFVADPSSGVAVIDSWDFGVTSPWLQVGGTSLAAPMWAGVIAIANQGRALAGEAALDGPTGTLPAIYSLPSGDFHDVTSGNNGYAAGPGYDLVTGRGTPIVNLVVAGLVGGVSQPSQSLPVIGSFTVNPSSVTSGTAAMLSAQNVQEPSGTISKVTFYRETNAVAGLQIGSDTLLGNGTSSGTTWSLAASTAGLSPGIYTYYAVATDSANVNSAPASAPLTVVAPAPANDNFAAATVITGTTVTVTGTNIDATKETGEPYHAGNVGGKSIWYNWTAPAGGMVSLNTLGSNFDTTLAVYTGGTVSGLTGVAGNDDSPAGGTVTSSLTFSAVKGVTYHIAVDGYNGASGQVILNLSSTAAPANDNFTNAAVLKGNAFTWTGSNVGATRELGEPYHAGNVGGSSVWFAWTATSNGTIQLNTHGSTFDTLLAVYTGSTISNLTTVAGNDDDLANGVRTSALTFKAVAGRTYYFAVDGYNGATGDITLNLSAALPRKSGKHR